MKILIAGASGFVGKALTKDLMENGHEVYALVRTKDHPKDKPHKLHWLHGDLLLGDKLPTLPKIEKAFYLVHCLKEDNQSFEYYESLAAVNFINWLRSSPSVNPGIVYLGGLGDAEGKLSPHLRSRQLTGSILGASGFPTTEFRASIVLGEGSASFEMIKAISERIPFRPEFSLLNQPCQPIALNDLLKYFEASLKLETEGHKVFEIGGPDQVTYGELLDLYAELANLKRKSLKVPEIDIKVLMKVLEYSLPELSDVGKKLAQSLVYPTIVKSEEAKAAFPEITPRDLRTSMDLAIASSQTEYKPLWEKDFLKSLLSDKILTQSGLFSPELLRNIDRVTKLKDILTRKT